MRNEVLAHSRPTLKRFRARFRFPDGHATTIIGRPAWALAELIAAGSRGVTPITHPAPRWSHYVFILRREYGLLIETIDEPHGGQFAGTHARYVLRSDVVIEAPTGVQFPTPQMHAAGGL